MGDNNNHDGTTAAAAAVQDGDGGSGGSGSGSSLTERYRQAVALVETSPETCISALESVQRDVQALGLFSNNEGMDDVGTRSIPFLAVDHYLATALVNLPVGPGGTTGKGAMEARRANVLHGTTLWSQFLDRLEGLEALSKEEVEEYHDLLDQQENLLGGEDEQHQLADGRPSRKEQQQQLPLAPDREAKIARFRAKQERQKQTDRLRALRERRTRYGTTLAPDDEMDGHDQESLDRALALSDLESAKRDALDGWASSLRELPMIDMMVKVEAERRQMARHNNAGGGGTAGTTADESSTSDGRDPRRRPPPDGKGLQVTHVTQDAATGQLLFKRDEIKSKVFRPGWNQPTVSLEEFGEREYHQAIEREEKQKLAEAAQLHQPKRYDDLVRDGMEDDADLVEASAKLDRDWDDWRDENPRGSGNKMANRGDRNF